VRLARDVGPPAREQELRDFLGGFRFTGEMVGQPVGSLSGGEKARLVLAMLVWQRPNLLLLDEPTNHLDLQTREALSMALNEYEGTVLLVSHDRALLREVCDEFWLVAGGTVEPFDGDLDDYQRWLLEQSREAARAARGEARASAAAPSRSPPPKAAPTKPAVARPAAESGGDDRKTRGRTRARLAERTRPLRVELQQIEARLARIDVERSDTEAALATGGLEPAQIADAGRQLNHIAAETAMLEERWLALSGEIESIEATANR
jgi:ATP-binding cassette, subfamily F, member 3